MDIHARLAAAGFYRDGNSGSQFYAYDSSHRKGWRILVSDNDGTLESLSDNDFVVGWEDPNGDAWDEYTQDNYGTLSAALFCVVAGFDIRI
jgi:hypothetical protein